MEGYVEITSQADLDQLLDLCSGFHDSLVKEIHLVDRAFVGPDRGIYMLGQYDACVLIQSQLEPYGLELVAVEVVELHTGSAQVALDGTGEYMQPKSLGEKMVTLKFDGGFAIAARQLFYRNRPDWLGSKIYLDGDVPAPNAVPAYCIEGKWRQCSNCADAWEEPSQGAFSTCPACGALTRLEETRQQSDQSLVFRTKQSSAHWRRGKGEDL